MSLNWKYKIDLVDEKVFGEIEKLRGVIIPDELKELIIKCNAATPDKYNFMVGSTERVFGSVLSFNKDELDSDLVFNALDTIDDKNLFPFGIDPFGNYICLNMENGNVLFWNHEDKSISSTEKNLKDFLDSLY